jgi:hypothetical protein
MVIKGDHGIVVDPSTGIVSDPISIANPRNSSELTKMEVLKIMNARYRTTLPDGSRPEYPPETGITFPPTFTDKNPRFYDFPNEPNGPWQRFRSALGSGKDPNDYTPH